MNILYTIINLEYFNLQPRQCFLIKLGGRRVEVSGVTQDLSDGEDQNSREGSMVEDQNQGGEIYATPESKTERSTQDTTDGHRGRHKKRSKTLGTAKIESCISFFKKYTPSPLENALLLPEWMMDPDLMYLTRDDVIFQKSIDIYRRRIISYSVEDVCKLYTDNSKFNALNGNISEYYLSLEDSVSKLRELLIFQCGENYEHFLNFIYSWFNKKSVKQNALLLVGPSNSCKMLFSYILQDLAVCVGQIANFNRYNQFPLQNCLDKRLLYWDEPNFEPSSLETIKMFLAGDKCPANIKFILYRPIL